MEDIKIIELYFARSEEAIGQTQNKYGKYCFYIADNILRSDSDAEECVNDTYLSVWNSIPPQRPVHFRCYLGRITRNHALNRYDYNNAQKRSPEFEAVADEFYECAFDSGRAFDEQYVLQQLINDFLSSLPKRSRVVFLQRYWYCCTVREIAGNTGLKESNIKVILHRTREKLKEYFKKEGIEI